MQKLMGDEGGWESLSYWPQVKDQFLVSINEHSASSHIIELASVLQRAPDLWLMVENCLFWFCSSYFAGKR